MEVTDAIGVFNCDVDEGKMAGCILCIYQQSADIVGSAYQNLDF
jgi:hypothetical protein